MQWLSLAGPAAAPRAPLQPCFMQVLPSDSPTVSHGRPRGTRARGARAQRFQVREAPPGARSGGRRAGLWDKRLGAGTSCQGPAGCCPQQQSWSCPWPQPRGSCGQSLGPAPALSSLPCLTQMRHPLAQSLSFPTSLYVPPLCFRLWVAMSQGKKPRGPHAAHRSASGPPEPVAAGQGTEALGSCSLH